jgi:hypothetical protein
MPVRTPKEEKVSALRGFAWLRMVSGLAPCWLHAASFARGVTACLDAYMAASLHVHVAIVLPCLQICCHKLPAGAGKHRRIRKRTRRATTPVVVVEVAL